ncbi:MAG: hypothetical protein HZB24_00385 [Desulfobacterales bacterium]|nr:hypothetical protein [Desulfobacterales bacterium]
MAVTIEGSVGLAGRNYPIDVAVVQKLLIDYFTQIIPVKRRSSRVITPTIAIDGECNQALIDLIKEVQTTAAAPSAKSWPKPIPRARSRNSSSALPRATPAY